MLNRLNISTSVALRGEMVLGVNISPVHGGELVLALFFFGVEGGERLRIDMRLVSKSVCVSRSGLVPLKVFGCSSRARRTIVFTW